MRGKIVFIVCLIATICFAQDLPVVVISCPSSVILPSAQQSALTAMILKVPDTGNLQTGDPAISSNTVTAVIYKDFVFTTLQLSYDWTPEWETVVSNALQSVNTNLTVGVYDSYSSFLTVNERVTVE